MALVIGGGPIKASFDGDDAGFHVSVQTELIRLRLPRDLFVPVIDGPDGPEADPDPDKSIESGEFGPPRRARSDR